MYASCTDIQAKLNSLQREAEFVGLTFNIIDEGNEAEFQKKLYFGGGWESG